MHMPLSTTKHHFLIAFMAMATLAPMGCRATRSGLSSIPGMSWIGPNDEAELASWSETNEPELPTPSQGATPQLATHGTSSAGGERNATSLAGRSPSTAESSEVPASYPDTGYPSPYSDETSSASRSYATGRYDQLPQQNQARGGSVQPSEVAPQRGFYGGEFDDVAASTSADATMPSDSGDDFSLNQPSASSPSRYGDDYGSSRYAAAETDGGYGDGGYGQDASNASTQGSGSAYGEGSTAVETAPPSRYAGGNSWAEDASQDFEQAGRQLNDRTAEATDRYATGANDWADAEFAAPSETGNPLEQASRDFKNSVGRAGQGIKDRWSEETEHFTREGKELVGEVGGKFRDVADQIQQQADDAGDRLKNVYQDFGTAGAEGAELAQDGLHHGQALAAQAAEESRQLETAWDQNPRDGGSRYSNPAASAASGFNANVGVDSPTNGTAAPRRSANPWQPGSTGRYPAGDSDQSRATGSYDQQVAPATYADEPAPSRFSPTYR